MPVLADLPQTWTYADLQRLLPDNSDSAGNDVDWRRFEIVDGALVVSPSANSLHELLVMAIRDAIRDAMPAGWSAIGALGIDLGGSYLIPDLVVARTQTLRERVSLLDPSDALLVTEIVSPSSRLTDRIVKPALYAAAGIAGYWRVETDPEVTLSAYALDPGTTAYTELGSWGRGQTATIERPFPARITIDDLIP